MLESATSQLPLWRNDEPSDHWTVRESHRARRLIVRVHYSGHVEVIVPRRTSRRAVEQFVESHRAWIERKQAESRERQGAQAQPFPPRQIELSACGEEWLLHFSAGAQRARVKVLGPGMLTIAGDMHDVRSIREALIHWLTRKAHQALAPSVAEIASQSGLRYGKVVIRRQRTRWGSCSTRGTISLNVCLLFQRPEVVRYLLIHELAHTVHMNHSAGFWRCVASLCPDYQQLDRELTQGWKRVPPWIFERR